MHTRTENRTDPITVECFEKIDFKGKILTINQDNANIEDSLEALGFGTPISSIRIVRKAENTSVDTEVTLYGKPDFEEIRLPIHIDPKHKKIELPNLLEMQQNLDFSISSIKIEN